MTRGSVRIVILSTLYLMLVAAIGLAAQEPSSVGTVDKNLLPAGPFVFEQNVAHPIYMDAFDVRPVIKSPDGKFGVTVTGPKESYAAWVSASPSASPDASIQVWPIQASVAILWRPNSQAFALTDQYSNDSYVLLCGATFRIEGDPLGLGVSITDLTPIVRKAFDTRAKKYYEGDDFEDRLFYAIALRWVGNDDLLVGISARSVSPQTFPNQGQKEWDFGYLIDVPDRKVLREVDKEQLRSEFKITVAN